jgi:hypothetical protein
MMQQAHAAMLEDAAVQQRRQHCQLLASAGAAADLALLQPSFDADAFWAPWPAQRVQQVLAQQTGTMPASAALDNIGADVTPSTPAGATQDEVAECDAAVSSSDASHESAAPAAFQGLQENSCSGAAPVVLTAAMQPMPELAAQAHQAAVQLLEQALSQALACQQLATARAAALALVRCHGLLQPQQAAECLAVAQGCKSATDMKAVFERWGTCCTKWGFPSVEQDQVQLRGTGVLLFSIATSTESGLDQVKQPVAWHLDTVCLPWLYTFE